jgi:hypothetical protein
LEGLEGLEGFVLKGENREKWPEVDVFDRKSAVKMQKSVVWTPARQRSAHVRRRYD